MLYCSKCGKQYSENAISCPTCGEPNNSLKNSALNNTTALLLCWFLGMFGAHRFYVGRVGSAIAQLVLTLTIGGIVVSSIWVLVDLVMIICQKFRDKDNNILKF